MVEPRNDGLTPRYSASARTEMRLWAVAENRPSTSFKLRPQSSSARLAPCAIRSMTDIPSGTSPRSDSATPTIAALPRLSPSITPLHGNKDGLWRLLAARLMHAKVYALPDAYLLRRDVLAGMNAASGGKSPSMQASNLKSTNLKSEVGPANT